MSFFGTLSGKLAKTEEEEEEEEEEEKGSKEQIHTNQFVLLDENQFCCA